jgi:outer membrane protein assembly factor BamB
MSGHDSLHTGRVDAPAIASPEIMWSKSLGRRIFAGAAIGEDGTIYVSVEGERFGTSGHGLFALAPSGDEKWDLPLPAPVRTTPLVGDDRILFGSYNGSFHAVALEGYEGWRYQPNDLSKRISLSSPAVALDGTIYFGDHGGSLQAMSPGGEPVWSFLTNDIVRAAPAIGQDGAIYFGSNDGVFYALNPDGSLRWSFETGGRIDSAAAIAPDGTIYFGSADGKLYALASEGTLKWSVGVGKGLMVFVSPALAEDGTIYVGTTGTAPVGTSQPQQEASYPFIAFNPQGEREWEYQLAYWVRSSPTVVSDGTIYFGGWDGNLYALSPEGELRWQIALGDVPVEQGIEAQPVVASDGTIFVGTWDGRFLAVGEED